MQGAYIPALSGLRGLAALLVVLAHLSIYGALPLFPFWAGGHSGVMLFFALSGFLMTHLYLDRPTSDLPDYVRARFGRVYPLYAVVIILSAAGTAASIPYVFHLTPIQMARHLVFLQGVKVFWTISVEFQFYALFAVLWLGLSRMANRRRAAIAILVAVYIALWIADIPYFRMSILSNLQLFIVGMLAALLRVDLSSRWASSVAIFALLALMFFVFFRASFGVFVSPVSHMLVAATLYFVACAKQGVVTEVLESKPAQKLGEWSFGIYLLHIPVIRLWYPVGVWMAVPALLTTILAAWASYRYLESPARRWITRRPAPPSAVAVA